MTSRRLVLVLAVVAATLVVPAVATAQLTPMPQTYSGDLWSRPRLTGDWGGWRDEAAKRGIFLDVDLNQTLQGVADGGRAGKQAYWGSTTYTLNVDTGKAGLWPGGFLTVMGESTFGETVQPASNAVLAVNADTLFPVPNKERNTLSTLQYTQFLSTWFGVTLGMLDILGGDANEFADDHKTKFLNTGFDFNMTMALMVPYAPLGAGVIVVPFKDAVWTAVVIDPTGSTSQTAFDGLFEDGVTVNSEFRAGIKPFGLPGHQLLGFAWSNKERFALKQDPGNILARIVDLEFPRLGEIIRTPSGIKQDILRRLILQRFPGLAAVLAAEGPFRKVSDSWAVYYNFDQYLWTRPGDPLQGVGIFFRAGVSDGQANPILHHFNVGIGGKGLVPGRPRDTWGVGWSRIDFSNNLFPILRERLDLGLDHEDTVEAYYNAAVTRWLGVTVDLQVIDQGLKRSIEAGPALKKVDTAVIGGLRVYARF